MFAPIDTSASGDTTLVTGIAGRCIKVMQYTIVAGGAVTVTFKSGSTALTGGMPFAQNGGAAVAHGPIDRGIPHGLFKTAPGADLKINLSDAVQVGGHMAYVVESP